MHCKTLLYTIPAGTAMGWLTSLSKGYNSYEDVLA